MAYTRLEGELLDVVSRMVRLRVPLEVEQAIQARDLVPCPEWADDQPTSAQLMSEILFALAKASEKDVGTLVGAYKAVKAVCVAMGVVGAEGMPVLRRTSAQVAASPNPNRLSEGMNRVPADESPEWPVKPSLREQRDQIRRRNRRDGIPTTAGQSQELAQ